MPAASRPTLQTAPKSLLLPGGGACCTPWRGRRTNIFHGRRLVKTLSKLVLTLSLAAAAILIASVPEASAQASRTWVSGVGDDVNPCSRTAPCKTFAGAISKTAAGGEINCLDPAGYGAVNITKSISIVCTGTLGSVLVAGTNGIIVNVTANDTVLLDGIELEGLTSGLDGVRVIVSGRTTIRNVTIRNFLGHGVNMVGTAGARVFLDNVALLHNGGGLNLQGRPRALRTTRLSGTPSSTTTSIRASGSMDRATHCATDRPSPAVP
jgi:hypothetical protein